MDLNLKPMDPTNFFKGEGGSFHKWFPSDFPIIAQTKVGAGRLLLHPRGFAVPHNSDSSKVGYVLQGSGVAGILFPCKSEEAVVRLKKGDLIPVPEGVTSWWFNDGDSDFEVLLVGDTRNALIPGDITYVVFAGPLGILQGFSSDYIQKVYDLNEEERDILLKSQTNGLIFKLQDDQTLPEPNRHSHLVFNIYHALPDAVVKGGGSVTVVTDEKFPFIGKSGLTAVLEKLEANAVRSPVYVADPSVQLIYIASGSGRVQIVETFLRKNIDAEVKAGQLVLVPKYFAVGKVAGEEGLECFTIITTTHPLLEELGGDTSIFGTFSPQVFQASFNVTARFEKLLRSKITKTSSLVPPSV
ncbi:legumin type B-like [Benincasa hispida]|uniref:legumin type B-like n=1 Tax=Benincasa hispida TaxID=102211 RepID=UPI0019009150|nr:legumin type B-like [Benincasa hispida]